MTTDLIPDSGSTPLNALGADDGAAVRRARAVAQTRILELQARELESRLNTRWFEGRFLVQSLVGGAVAAGLFSAWMIGYAQPIISRKQEVAQLDAAIQAKRNERQQLENEERARVMESENRRIREELTSLQQINNAVHRQQADSAQQALDLQRRLNERDTELRALGAKIEQDSALRRRLAALSQAAQDDSKRLQETIDRLQSEKMASEARARTISDGLTVNALKDTAWRHDCLCTDDINPTYVQLRGDGQFLMRYPSSEAFFACDRRCSWEVRDSQLVLNYNDGRLVERFDFPRTTATQVSGVSQLGKATLERIDPSTLSGTRAPHQR